MRKLAPRFDASEQRQLLWRSLPLGIVVLLTALNSSIPSFFIKHGIGMNATWDLFRAWVDHLRWQYGPSSRSDSLPSRVCQSHMQVEISRFCFAARRTPRLWCGSWRLRHASFRNSWGARFSLFCSGLSMRSGRTFSPGSWRPEPFCSWPNFWDLV